MMLERGWWLVMLFGKWLDGEDVISEKGRDEA